MDGVKGDDDGEADDEILFCADTVMCNAYPVLCLVICLVIAG